MAPDCKRPKLGQLNPVDRLSDLPDFILHHIIYFLGTTEAYRTSILSKRWSQISATNPVLEFCRKNFRKDKKNQPMYCGKKGITASFLEYIETRMKRYSNENLRIRKLTLEIPNCNVVGELACKLDEWIGIAVRNQVVEFVLRGPRKYKLPGILLSAKSLTRLDCSSVKIPCYEAIDLVSLETLTLCDVVVEERMLSHIISSCLLLKILQLGGCSGFTNIVISPCSKLVTLDVVSSLPVDGTIILETSSLENFSFIDYNRDYPWPIISKAGLLRNLRMMNVTYLDTTDEAFAELLSELPLLETLVCGECQMLSNIRISSTRLKKICFDCCFSLLDVVIDAPSLKKFKLRGPQNRALSITINSEAKCDISLDILPDYLDTVGFLKLKKLLTGLKSCNALKILFFGESSELEIDEIEFDEEELENEQLGPPCDIRKLKLTPSARILSKPSLSAFLNALFWTCHPDIISLRVDLGAVNHTIEFLMQKLNDMAKCWRHPLKRIEVEGTNCSSLLEERKLDIQLSLYW